MPSAALLDDAARRREMRAAGLMTIDGRARRALPPIWRKRWCAPRS